MCIDVQEAAPLVSVIMPAYNTGPFITKAIASVLSQSVTDWELIVIDDGSTDGTKELIAEFARKDPRICPVINEENIGVARTRNQGLELCRGKYVALLDSDDYWKPNFLEKMLSRARETNADIIYCSYEIVDEQEKKLCNDFIVPPSTTFNKSIVRAVISCSTVLMTEHLAKNNRFPTNIYHEDTAMWFQLLRDGNVARGVPEILAAYRQRADSRSSDKLISAVRRWEIYRKHLKLNVVKSVITMVGYAYFGFIKYKRIKSTGG